MKSTFLAFLVLFVATVFLPAQSFATGHTAESEDGHAAEASHDHELEFFTWDDDETPPLGYMFINFALLCVLVFLIMRKPIGNKVRNRKSDFEKALEEANALKAEAEKALADAKAKSEMLDLEMAKIRKEVQEGGKRESERIAEDSKRRAQRMKADTEALVAQELSRMTEDIRAELVENITAAAEKAIVEKITSTDQDKLAREYLASVTKTTSDGSRQ